MMRIDTSDKATVSVQPGDVLVVSGQGVGFVTRFNLTGVQSYAPVSYNGEEKLFGPFSKTEGFEIESTLGPIDYVTRPYVAGQDDIAPAWTGWVNITDGLYTEGSPFQPPTGQWTHMVFGNANVLDTQKPLDVDELFDLVSSTITGRAGDGIAVTIEFTAEPTTATQTFLEAAIDIGGAVGRIYPRTLTFPKGQGNPRTISFSFNGYTLDTWEANGGKLVFNPNAAIDIYGARIVVHRTHKAR